MTIHEASALIGVSPATLRRWCDQGDVKAFTTPGGHRRFSRAAVLGLVPAGRRSRPSLESLGDSPDRVVGDVRRSAPGMAAKAGWGDAPAADLETMRELGRRMTAQLLTHLEATDPVEAAEALGAAEDLATAHGTIAAERGLETIAAIDAFLSFRGVFIHELCATARSRDLDATEATDLIECANAAVDRLLRAVVGAHEKATAARGCGCSSHAVGAHA